MLKVSKEHIVAIIDKYKVGKMESFKTFSEEQEDLSIFAEVLSEEVMEQLENCDNDECVKNVIKSNIVGLMIIVYTLFKNQIEIEELEKQWNS